MYSTWVTGESAHIKRNAETGKQIPSGTLGSPIFTDRVAGSKEDQALVEKLIERGLAGKGSRAVAPDGPGAAALRAARVAARFNKRVVWVEGLTESGLTFRGLDRGVIFLNPDSGRSAQVLTAHELTHQMAGENQRGFAKLTQALSKLIPPEAREDFKKKHDPDGTMSPSSLWQEVAGNFVADWAYRAHAGAVSTEDAARGTEFTGYRNIYLPKDKQAEADAAVAQFVADAGHSAASFRNAETLTEPSAEQSAKAAAVPPKNIEVTAALAHFKRTLSDQVKALTAVIGRQVVAT